VCDFPFSSRAILEQLRAGHEEHPPPLDGNTSRSGIVMLPEYGKHLVMVVVKVFQPRFARAAVVCAIDRPLVLNQHVPLEVRQQVGRRHDAAGEKMPGHPVRFTADLKCIGRGPMAKNMHKQFSVRS